MKLTGAKATGHGRGQRPPPPPGFRTAEPKSFWATGDIFKDEAPIVASAFIHRDYQIGLHAHEFIEVNVILRGSGRHNLSGQTARVTAGDVFVIPPRVQHGYQRDRRLDVHHLLLHPRFIEAHALELRVMPGFLMLFSVEPYFREELGRRHSLRLSQDDLPKIKALLDIITQENREPEDLAYGVGELLALALVARLCRYYMAQHPGLVPTDSHRSHWHAIRAVLDRVASHYADKLTLDDLAHASRMNRNYFCRIFHEVTGLTPMEYLTQYRLNQARKLLNRSDLNITEIALQTGFYDAAHFSRLFRQTYGQTPSHARLSIGG